MSSQVRLVKKLKAADSTSTEVRHYPKSEEPPNREISRVIKTWIREFRLGQQEVSEIALVRLTK